VVQVAVPWNETVISYRTAIFRQINKDKRATHHDALEFPNGEIALLTALVEGQQATVLQLPSELQKAQEVSAASRAVQLDWVLTCSVERQGNRDKGAHLRVIMGSTNLA
jgi:hypothetical protein